MRPFSLKQVALLGGLMAALTGCGSYPLAPVDDLPRAAAPVALTMNASQAGSLVVKFSQGYSTQATSKDLCFLSVTLTGSSINYPINQTISWPMAHDAVFSNLTPGTYTVKIDGLDKYYAVIASVSQSSVDVKAGSATPVSMTLSLGATGGGGAGSISLGVVIDDGLVPSPTPTVAPTPAPSTSPVPTPTPSSAPAAAAFSDGFENGLSNWAGSWQAASYSGLLYSTTVWHAAGGYGNTSSFGATPGGDDGKVLEPGSYDLTLASGVDLSNVASPVLRFDLNNFTAQYYFKTCEFIVEASADGGATWSQVMDLTASQTSWARKEVSLAGFKSSNVKVRFRFVYDYYLGVDAMSAPSLDNVYLGAS